MQTAVVQINPVFGDVSGNISLALTLMELKKADLYVLPELFATGYNFVDKGEVERLSEPPDGGTFAQIHAFCRQKGAFVAYGFAERSGDRFFNSAALVGPRGLVGLYRKVHLFDRENLFFTPGDVGFPVYDLSLGRVGLMICFDWVYPESARTLALKGAQLIAHPSNLVLPHCPDAMVTRCLENRVFAATANRIGKEERGGINLSYIGKSEIVSPRGEILTRLGETEEGISVVDLELSLADDKRINRFNDLLEGRRPDQYTL